MTNTEPSIAIADLDAETRAERKWTSIAIALYLLILAGLVVSQMQGWIDVPHILHDVLSVMGLDALFPSAPRG